MFKTPDVIYEISACEFVSNGIMAIVFMSFESAMLELMGVSMKMINTKSSCFFNGFNVFTISSVYFRVVFNK